MSLVAGTKLGPYEIQASLGAGGMGEVYRARDTRLGREVAIKVLPAEVSGDSKRRERFEREARAVSALNHPHICTLHDVGHQNGTDFLVMEYIEGETLARRLQKGALPLEQFFRYAMQIADALEKAHRRGIVHRDLKPGNIMLGKAGAKLLDFGLAKPALGHAAAETLTTAPTGARAITAEGTIVGTFQYMSPEQLEGKEADARSDIFAFGAVLYEMATAKKAFEGKSQASIIAAILEREPPAVSSLQPLAPRALDHVVKTCLAKDPDQRWQSAHDIELQLKCIAEGGPAGTAAVGGATSGRSIVPWVLAGFLAITTLVSSWAFLTYGRRLRNAPMHFGVVTSVAGVAGQPSLSPDGRSVAFVADHGGQPDIWVGLVSGGSLARITNDPHLKYRPRWSPDGSKIAYGQLNEAGIYDIWMVPSLGGTARKILTGGADPAWAPDGHSLVYTNFVSGSLWICDANGGNPRQLTEADGTFAQHHPAYSHDGRQVVYVRHRRNPRFTSLPPYGELEIVELSTGKTRAVTHDGVLALSPAWSPADDFIYFASSRGGAVNIWRIAARGGEPEQVTASQGDDAELDLSVDGKRLAFSTYQFNINIAEMSVDAKSGVSGLKWLTTDSARAGAAPAYSHDGKRLAYFTSRRGAENETVWVVDIDGLNATPLVQDDFMNLYPRWSRDDRSLIYTARNRQYGQEARRAWLSGQAPEKLPVACGDNYRDVASDGRLVCYDSAKDKVEVVDPQTKKIEVLERIGGRMHRWSPDAHRLAYVISSSSQNDPESGLWIYNFEEKPRQVFRGWIAWYAWAGENEILVIEGKPDLKARLWVVRLDGRAAQGVPGALAMNFTYQNWLPNLRFDVHPDGRHIAIETARLRQANIGIIENVR